jgi:hypothetical protein
MVQSLHYSKERLQGIPPVRHRLDPFNSAVVCTSPRGILCDHWYFCLNICGFRVDPICVSAGPRTSRPRSDSPTFPPHPETASIETPIQMFLAAGLLEDPSHTADIPLEPALQVLHDSGRSLARSARARRNGDALQAPITKTPFDCSPKFPIKPKDLDLKALSKVEFLALFGRPMCAWHRVQYLGFRSGNTFAYDTALQWLMGARDYVDLACLRVAQRLEL